MPIISIDINQDAFDALQVLATSLGWTPEELAGSLTEDTFEDTDQTAAYMHFAFRWPRWPVPSSSPCTGNCKGKGVGISVTPGTCPTPMDPAKKTETENAAKVLARKEANSICMTHGWDCLCRGGQMTINHSNARNAKDMDGLDICRYRASAYYTGGTCTLTS